MNKATIFKNPQWAVTVDGDLVAESFGVIIERECVSLDLIPELTEKYEWFDKTHYVQAHDKAIENTAA